MLTEAEAVHLLVGAALLVSCFVIAQNVSYRAIYFLFVLPALIVSWRGAAWVAVLLMWNSGLRLAINRVAAWFGISTAPDGMLHFAIWLLRELAWWAVITLLAALLLRLSLGINTISADRRYQHHRHNARLSISVRSQPARLNVHGEAGIHAAL